MICHGSYVQEVLLRLESQDHSHAHHSRPAFFTTMYVSGGGLLAGHIFAREICTYVPTYLDTYSYIMYEYLGGVRRYLWWT